VEAKTAGVAALVHCAAGISRSTSIVLAYLMKHEKMALKEAFILVKTQRKGVSPNKGFVKQLLRFEKELFGSNSVDEHQFYMLK
jgi:protein-tyrosine phosphatase